MIDWTITLHSSLADAEVEELAVTASEHGIEDWTITESGRIIKAETPREDDSINWIAEWLAEALFEVEVIAQIKEERIYWPEFDDGEELVIDLRLDTEH